MSDTTKPAHRGFRFNSLLVKIAGILLAGGTLLAAMVTWNNTRTTVQMIREDVAHAALETNSFIAVGVAEAFQEQSTARIQTLLAQVSGSDNHETLRLLALDAGGEILVSKGHEPGYDAELRALATRAAAQGSSVSSADGLLVATPVAAPSGEPAGTIASAWSVKEAIAAEYRAAILNLGIAFALVSATMFAMMLAANRWIVAPISRLAETVTRLAREDFDVAVTAAGRGDELGDIGRAIGHLRDELREGRDRARDNRFRSAAFEASSAAIMMADTDMRITSVNRSLHNILDTHVESFRATTAGFDPDAIVGQDMDFFHAGPLKQRVRALLTDPANLPYHADIAIAAARFHLTISRVENERGALDGFVIEWTDQTEEFMNRAILNSIAVNQVQAEFSLDGSLLCGNKLFAEAMGADVETLPGAASRQIFDFDEPPAGSSQGTVFDQLNRGTAVFGRFRLIRTDGTRALIEGGFAPVADTKGTLLRVILIGKDVTADQDQLARAEAGRARLQAAQETVVETLRNALGNLAKGDLTTRIETAFSGDYDRLRLDFNQAAETLQAAMKRVVENAELIRGEASEIATAADNLSSRTERQAATLEQTASALDQLTASVKSSADGAAHANTLVATARQDAEASGAVVREAVGAMGEIERSSQQISKITGVIDDIAFQTNLLALNAGVEAARAGDAGRGFAVVASEVRALAQRSSDAAREINSLISASDNHVRRGVDLVDQAGRALEGIVDSVQKISQNVSEIAQSSSEQSSGLAEINTAINQLDQVTQQNAAMFEETTAASHALTREAEALTGTMGSFSTGTEREEAPRNLFAPGTPTRRKAAAARAAGRPGRAVAASAQATAAAIAQDDGWDEF